MARVCGNENAEGTFGRNETHFRFESNCFPFRAAVRPKHMSKSQCTETETETTAVRLRGRHILPSVSLHKRGVDRPQISPSCLDFSPKTSYSRSNSSTHNTHIVPAGSPRRVSPCQITRPQRRRLKERLSCWLPSNDVRNLAKSFISGWEHSNDKYDCPPSCFCVVIKPGEGKQWTDLYCSVGKCEVLCGDVKSRRVGDRAFCHRVCLRLGFCALEDRQTSTCSKITDWQHLKKSVPRNLTYLKLLSEWNLV